MSSTVRPKRPQNPNIHEARDWILARLEEEQALRHQRGDLIKTAFAPAGEPEWVNKERECLVSTINDLREAKPNPVTVQEVYKVEMQAVGHVDYVQKLARYCAELVMRK